MDAVTIEKTSPILMTVSTKNGSGTMFINKSVLGSKSHKLFLKKILWKTIKYFVKFVDIIAVSNAAMAKNKPVPMHRMRGKKVFIFVFSKERIRIHKIPMKTHVFRNAMAARKSPFTSSMWAISFSLKNSRSMPFTFVRT